MAKANKPQDAISIDQFTQKIINSTEFGPYVSHIAEFPPRPGVISPSCPGLDPRLVEKILRDEGRQLFSHQAIAFDLAREGKDLLICTGTNSGKSLCYNLPVLQSLIEEPHATAIYLFPTKALANDQVEKLNQFGFDHWLKVANYDGDTPKNKRSAIRKTANIIVTNPDMLHVGILPHHEEWTKFFKSLKFIVIDELHLYKGVFGSHVAHVLRRLLLLCDWHRSCPQIIGCSATIGNPEEAFEKLTGRHPTIIAEDGSRQEKKKILFMHAPDSDIYEAKGYSPLFLASSLMVNSVQNGKKVMVFNRSRQAAEVLLLRARAMMIEQNGNPDSLESYRGGYSIAERRKIEKALFSGKINGISVTSAMELGIDIGALDVVILNGFPGSMASFWQQIGRAGRGKTEGLAIYIAHQDPLEEFLSQAPNELLNQKSESICLMPENRYVLEKQLLCAAYERALSATELQRFGLTALETAEELELTHAVRFSAGRFYFASFEPPAPKTSIRSVDGKEVRLMCGQEQIGSMESWRARSSAFPGAIYLHRGLAYEVVSSDIVQGVSHLDPSTKEYYTISQIQSEVDENFAMESFIGSDFRISLSAVTVKDQVVSFEKIPLTAGLHEIVEFKRESNKYDTIGVCFEFEMELTQSEFEEVAPRTIQQIHAIEHALLSLAPIFAGCDRQDLGSSFGIAMGGNPSSVKKGTVTIFDKVPGGVGLAGKLYEVKRTWIDSALMQLQKCGCENGCFRCLYLSGCSERNQGLDKDGAINLLREIVQG